MTSSAVTAEIAAEIVIDDIDESELEQTATITSFQEKIAQSKIIEKYDLYKAGKISRQEYCEHILEVLEFYIKSRITAKHRTLGADYEDLMQQGYLAIMEKVDVYDPRRSRPTSFFTDYIDQFQKDALKNSGMTRYYLSMATKLERIAKKYGFEGILDPRLEPDKLSILADVSLTTVLETIKAKAQSNVSSYEAVTDNVELDTESGFNPGFKNPETCYLENETHRFLQSELDKLSPLQQFLVINITAAANPMSYRKIVKLLKDPEYHYLLTDKEGKDISGKIDQTTLEQALQQALRRLSHNTNLNKLVSFKKKRAYEIIEEEEQASVDDIFSAIENGALEDIE